MQELHQPLPHRPLPETTRPAEPRPIGTGVRTGSADDLDTSGTIHVTWGAVVDDFEGAGMTVGEVLTAVEAAYNIPPGVRINVNGVEADTNTLLAVDDHLEFVRAAGEKGGR